MPRSYQQGRQGKKRPKGFYKKSAAGKRPRLERKLDVGMSGILITCNRDERECTKEAYDLFNEYADELYGPQVQAGDPGETATEVDIADALEQEVAEMKEHQEQKTMRFQAVDSRAKNLVFIKTNIPEDPSKFLYHILLKLKEAGQAKFQHIQRLHSATVTCRAALDEIEKSLKPLLAVLFASDDDESKVVKYAVLFRMRNNNGIQKNEVVKVVDTLISSVATCKHSVDLDNAEYTILVDVVCNICCLSILKDYNALLKYNARRLVGDPSDTNPGTAGQKQEGAGPGSAKNEGVGENLQEQKIDGENAAEDTHSGTPGDDQTTDRTDLTTQEQKTVSEEVATNNRPAVKTDETKNGDGEKDAVESGQSDESKDGKRSGDGGGEGNSGSQGASEETAEGAEPTDEGGIRIF